MQPTMIYDMTRYDTRRVRLKADRSRL